MRIITLEELKVVITAETSELRSQLAQVKSEVNSTTKEVTKSASKMSSSFKSLFKFFSVAAVVTGLVKLSKQAIQTASDLEEVQNVVDVAFGSMVEDVNEFASTTITTLGMSELAAKKFASTYMAMGNGMQVAKQAGKEMAIELTKLTGDMASFYNVEQDVAATALKSVYTGETESLKKFGVVMTEANLQAFALSQGITKQYKDMSQAEKVALRYNYVLNSTKNAQGDFARTSNSWANQVRILKEQFNQLLGILGNGLVKAIKPVVQAMNQLLASAISVAQAMAKAFGWTEQLTGISTSVESGASAMEDFSSATSDAAKSANKLTEIAGFDELNTLSSKNDSSDASSGISDFTVTTAESTQESEQALNNTTSRFRQFVEDVRDILKGWKDTIPKLEINFDKEKALSNLEAIGKNIANIIGGWGSFVVTIGIDILNDLDIGGIANEFLGLTESVSGLASEITDVLVPAFEDFYNTALSPVVKWIGTVLKDAIAFCTKLLDDVAKWFGENCLEIQELIHSTAEAFSEAWDLVSPIFNVILAVVGRVVKSIVEDVGWFVGRVIKSLNKTMQTLTNLLAFIKRILNKISTFLNKIISGINKIKLPDWGILGSAAGKGINIPLIPQLAKGGILSTPTFAMLGEYPGATNNPEIATPQSLLESIIANKNGELISAWSQMTRQLISAIEAIDMEVSIGDDVIAQSAQRGNNSYRRMTGKPLIT